jgi:putative FmdB family regulatory protein
MPIYEYQCTRCGNVEEAFQRFSDKPLTRCRQCSGKLHKLISNSTFHLKGSGWYVTDYANKSNKSSPHTAKKEPASAGADTSSGASAPSSDSKPKTT